jgi:hypothetical protein
MLQRLASLIAFSVILINCFSTSPALAQKSASIRFNPPPPPPDRGLPGNRGEGASRGDCTALDLPLTALVPSYKQRLNQGVGETYLRKKRYLVRCFDNANRTAPYRFPGFRGS